MFDTLNCEYPLPDPEFQHEDFQTRDLGESLGYYLITHAGRLVRFRYQFEAAAKEGIPTHRRRRSTNPFVGDIDVELINFEDLEYHGDIHFYATTTSQKAIEYVVRFTHGTVEWICNTQVDVTDYVESMKQLAMRAEWLERQHLYETRKLFQELETLDPVLFNRTVQGQGDLTDAALWFAAPGFGELNPYRMVANGKREEVLKVLIHLSDGEPG